MVYKKFENIEIRYFMLGVFYDFTRVTKKYKKD